MLVSRLPVSHLDPALPSGDALSNHGVLGGGSLMALRASRSAVLVDAVQVSGGLVVRESSEEHSGSATWPSLIASDFVSVGTWSASEPESIDQYAPVCQAVALAVSLAESSLAESPLAGAVPLVGAVSPAESVSVGEIVQPVPRGSSLVASFRLLQTKPRNGFARSLGAMVPCPGSSGGTAWRL